MRIKFIALALLFAGMAFCETPTGAGGASGPEVSLEGAQPVYVPCDEPKEDGPRQAPASWIHEGGCQGPQIVPWPLFWFDAGMNPHAVKINQCVTGTCEIPNAPRLWWNGPVNAADSFSLTAPGVHQDTVKLKSEKTSLVAVLDEITASYEVRYKLVELTWRLAAPGLSETSVVQLTQTDAAGVETSVQIGNCGKIKVGEIRFHGINYPVWSICETPNQSLAKVLGDVAHGIGKPFVWTISDLTGSLAAPVSGDRIEGTFFPYVMVPSDRPKPKSLTFNRSAIVQPADTGGLTLLSTSLSLQILPPTVVDDGLSGFPLLRFVWVPILAMMILALGYRQVMVRKLSANPTSRESLSKPLSILIYGTKRAKKPAVIPPPDQSQTGTSRDGEQESGRTDRVPASSDSTTKPGPEIPLAETNREGSAGLQGEIEALKKQIKRIESNPILSSGSKGPDKRASPESAKADIVGEAI